MNSLEQFLRQQYINLETFRKSGASMKTPVWFAMEGETIYVLTAADSGKVKRIRNNSWVNVTPCKMDGTPIGTWVPARAVEAADVEIMKTVDRLLDKKYGLVKKYSPSALLARAVRVPSWKSYCLNRSFL